MLSYKNVLTTCPYCGTGCNFYLQVMDDEIVGILPSKSHPVSQGKLCIKGWTANEFVSSKERLTTPLIRRDGKLVPASWDEALGLVSEKFQEYKGQYGPDSLAVLSSAKCTNEENYLMMKFTRSVLGTNNIDHCARL
jgi:predicted molibdopterin-dependent oxidoreductase YjgC